MLRFSIGKEYPRTDLLAAVGSKQGQSGIIWGPEEPDVVIVTSGGRHSKRAGYGDEQHPDGSWDYFGQGTTGDQDPNSFANKLLSDGNRTVLLFSSRHPKTAEVQERKSYASFYKYNGIFLVSSWNEFIPQEGKRKGDKLLRFHLVPSLNYMPLISELELEAEFEVTESLADSFQTLRKKLRKQSSRPKKGYISTREFRRGSAHIRLYARLRANGVCENCENTAPFIAGDGLPFLEVHHIERLADDGPDIPENVAAVCPNCHREAHFGGDIRGFRQRLKEKIRSKELLFDNSINL